MKTKRSFLSLLLAAAAVVLTLYFLFPSATNAADVSVSIEQSESVFAIQDKIQAELTNASSGKVVTVTGEKTGVSELLALTIPKGVKVLWQATYSDNGSSSYNLIQLSGGGIFEVGAGGSLSVSSAGKNAIYSWVQITVVVSDTGKVWSAADAGCAIYIAGKVLVTGGEVSARSTTIFVVTSNSAVTVTGGSVSSTMGRAILASNTSSTVTVSGGLVFAYGKGIIGTDNVIQCNNVSGFTGASGTGVVIAWNKGADNTEYESGTATDIFLSPTSGATAVWDEQDGQKGIAYANGANEGFIPLIPALIGKVTITGTPIYGETLTADTSALTFEQGNSGVTELGDLSYQWKRNGTDITDAMENLYTLVSADVGQTITAKVEAANCFGDRTSDATAAVAKAMPSITPPTAANIYKGDSLSASALLDGTASVPGDFTWTDDTHVPTTSGNFDVTFTPTYTNNYSNAATQASVTVIDRDALDAKIAEAKAIKRENYITSTWDALQEAITGAETTLEPEAQHVTQEAIDAALAALTSAIDGLRHIYIPPPENNTNQHDDADEPTETPERPAATPEDDPFDDVGQNDWFYEDVMFAYSRGLMTGTSARKFSPDAPMTRGMIVTVSHRMESEPAARRATTFGDVADGKYYTEAVAWAEGEGIVDGYGNGLFGPEDDITRQDLALLFLRYARYKGVTLPEIRAYADFDDDKDVSDYAREATETMYKAGIISGKPGNRLDPKGTATRAEVAAMLRRFLEAVEK
jgi:hypothetical protein